MVNSFLFHLLLYIINHMNAKNGYLIPFFLCIWYFITNFKYAPSKFINFFEAVSLKLAYFAPPNGLGQNFPQNYNYSWRVKNSNTISFVLTSLVTSSWLIIFSRFPPTKFINFWGGGWLKMVLYVENKILGSVLSQ